MKGSGMMPRFGFIHDKLEIKFLILYILTRAVEPLDFPTLTDLTLCDEGVDYFQYVEALAELVKTDHLKQTEGDRYTITEKGIKNGAICESSLPYSVRMHADHELSLLNARLRRNAQVKSTRIPRSDSGFTVRLSLDDDFENIMTLDLLAPNEAQAQRLEDNFRRHPEKIYNAIMKAVLDNYQEMGRSSEKETN